MAWALASLYGIPLVGIKHGYNGLLRKSSSLFDDMEELHLDTVLDIADRPGTYLRTARAEFGGSGFRARSGGQHPAGHVASTAWWSSAATDPSTARKEYLCQLGIHCIGIPGTIDNDLAYTEMTLGFDTAVNVCVDAVRSIRATSRSHDRPHVEEVIGINCGDIASSHWQDRSRRNSQSISPTVHSLSEVLQTGA